MHGRVDYNSCEHVFAYRQTGDAVHTLLRFTIMCPLVVVLLRSTGCSTRHSYIRASKMDKLLCISAFYKNDQPNGIGVSMSYEAGDLDQIMAIIKQHWDE